jgi:hypothetical protein
MAGIERHLVAYIEIAQRAERRQVTDIEKGSFTIAGLSLD